MQKTLYEYEVGYYSDAEIEVDGKQITAKDYVRELVTTVIDSTIDNTTIRGILKSRGIEVKRGTHVFAEKTGRKIVYEMPTDVFIEHAKVVYDGYDK